MLALYLTKLFYIVYRSTTEVTLLREELGRMKYCDVLKSQDGFQRRLMESNDTNKASCFRYNLSFPQSLMHWLCHIIK